MTIIFVGIFLNLTFFGARREFLFFPENNKKEAAHKRGPKNTHINTSFYNKISIIGVEEKNKTKIYAKLLQR